MISVSVTKNDEQLSRRTRWMNKAVVNMEFYVIYTIVWLFSNIIYQSNTINVANQSSTNCVCRQIFYTTECQCPDEETNKINIRVESNVVNIYCRENIDWHIENLLPSSEFGNVDACRFWECPLPSNFVDILDRLKVNNTKELKFDHSKDFPNITLTADYFKGLHHLKRLMLISYIKDIDEDAFHSLDNLIELGLEHNEIQLQNGTFKDLSNLKSLNLADNKIIHLPPLIFQNLTKLKHLGLSFNKLTTISSSIFKSLRDLELLQLLENHLEYLPENVFDYAENLKQVDISTNNLQSVPKKLFSNTKLIETVWMNKNPHLTFLPNNLFSNLNKLREISLSDCIKLATLPDNLFKGSIHLRNIYLQWNAIEHIPENIFEDLVELRELDLSYNKITDLPDEALSFLINLETLYLQNNLITNIRMKYFYHLENLKTLNLANNKISSIEATSFHTLNRLNDITLANNYIDVPVNVSLFANSMYLQRIDLSRNNITFMDNFAIFTKLEELDLSYNQIKEINITKIFTMTYSVYINLKNNNITKLYFSNAEAVARSEVNSYASNPTVFISGNPIECNCHLYDFIRYLDDTAHDVMPRLITINDADSLMCSSPNDFLNVSVTKLKPSMLTCSLQELEIENTFTDKCTYKFRTWDKSLVVNCTNLNLTEAPKLFLSTQNLFNQTEMHLENNLLTAGPRENLGYENVTKLFLSSNNITDITWIPPKLKELKLHNNNISYLNDDSLRKLTSSPLTVITLGRNPWKCDCSIINIISFLKSNLETKKIDTDYIKCKDSGKQLIASDDICLEDIYWILGYVIIFSVVALLIVTPLAVFYRFQHEIKMWLFVHNMCLGCVTEYESDKDKLYDAFISYSQKDEAFVLNELVPVLEKSPRPYKLCFHIRNGIGGELILNQITTSVEKSRRTLVILSRNFVESEWGKMEFRTAHKQALNEGRARVILILYGDIDINSDLDDELKAFARTNTYLKWGDPWFWERLTYALPHLRAKKQAMRNSPYKFNDKLDLANDTLLTMNPQSTPPVDYLLLKNNPLNFKPNLIPPTESGNL